MLLRFTNATGAGLEAEVEPDYTADEIVANLIAEQFISEPKTGERWALFSAGQGKLSGSKTIAESGYRDGDEVQLVTVVQA